VSRVQHSIGYFEFKALTGCWPCITVDVLIQTCAKECGDKGSLLVSYCLSMFSECLTQLAQTSLYVVQKVVWSWRLKLALILW